MVSGRHDDYQNYLEFPHGRFLNIAGGRCENGLLRCVALGSTPTIHQKLPELFGLVSARLIDIEIDRLDTKPDGARMRVETVRGLTDLAVRPTDAIAIGMVFNKPMYISEPLNSEIEWGIMWGRIKLPWKFGSDEQQQWDYFHGIERSVEATIRGILQAYHERFAVQGISHGEVTFRVEIDELTSYTSFLSVPFYVNDVSLWSVDFPVFRKGRPSASLNKIALWFETQIQFSEITEHSDDEDLKK